MGGTFTDVVLANADGDFHVDKVPTTPDDPRVGVIEGVRHVLSGASVAPGDVSRVVHGTTLATNVILEQKGSPLAFVVTEGFADLLRLGREARVEDDRYDLFFTTPAPPVDPNLTFEVPERITADGSVLRALSADAAADVARRVAEASTSAVAICLLNAYAQPRARARHRTRAARRAPGRVRRGVHRGVARDARVRARDDHGDVRVRRAGDGRLPRRAWKRSSPSSASAVRSRSWTRAAA